MNDLAMNNRGADDVMNVDDDDNEDQENQDGMSRVIFYDEYGQDLSESEPDISDNSPAQIDETEAPHPPELRSNVRPEKRATRESDETVSDEDEETTPETTPEPEADKERGPIGDLTMVDHPFTSVQVKLASKENAHISIGTAFQAQIDQGKARSESPERDFRVWGCDENMDEEKLHKYVSEACGRYKVPIDRCLYILQKCDNDFEKAMSECQNRNKLSDTWAHDEEQFFMTAIFHFGKNFKKIHSAMPNRSLSSIIQYYYNTKATKKYKSMVGIQHVDKDDYNNVMKHTSFLSRSAAGFCENCTRESPFLLVNHSSKTHECQACTLFFNLMRKPRKISLKTLAKLEFRVFCPEFMKPYIATYRMLAEPRDGQAHIRLGIGSAPNLSDEDEDDECMILDDCSLLGPSEQYIIHVRDDSSFDKNSCRMTRDFNTKKALHMIDNLRKIIVKCIPLIWRVRQTKCMEDITLLNNEAHKLMLIAQALYKTISWRELKAMYQEINELRARNISPEPVLTEGMTGTSRSGRLRIDPSWTKQEKKDAVRCFHWYGTDFAAVASVMGTKTADLVEAFFEKHKAILEKSIDDRAKEVRQKCDLQDENTPSRIAESVLSSK